MKQIIAILALLILASCASVKRNTQKSSVSDNTETKIIDKSIIETTKEIDTTVKTKKDSASVVLKVKDESTGSDAFGDMFGDNGIIEKTVKQGGITLTASYDKNKKEFTAKAVKEQEEIPVKIKETTKTQNDITKEEKKDIKTKEVKKDIERESNMNWTKVFIWGGVILGIVLLIIALIKLPNWNK